MRRREFITVVGSAAASWPLAARAQQTGKVWHIALIGAVAPPPAYLSAFREALQQRGWTEGKNLSIDLRWLKGSFAQEPGLISEVLHSNVDVIVAWATPSALAARRATSTIPIVFLGISDPVGSELAASLGHPSTGVPFLELIHPVAVSRHGHWSVYGAPRPSVTCNAMSSSCGALSDRIPAEVARRPHYQLPPRGASPSPGCRASGS